MSVDCWIRASGSVICITDDLDADMPEFDFEKRPHVWANQWSICVATLIEADGETHLVASEEPFETTHSLAFDGEINTPTHRVSISDANLTEFAVLQSSSLVTRIRIWTDHATEPELILVTVG